MHILLIDDEPAVRDLVQTMLAGHTVVAVGSGRAGLDLLDKSDFDVVLTDIIMPEMEGIEIIMAIRKRLPKIRLVAMSGGGRTGNIDFLSAASKLGADAILRKPFTIGALKKAIGEGEPPARTS